MEIFIFLSWLPQAIQQLLTWTYWLQIKEYRLDRFFSFMKLREGRLNLGVVGIIIKISIILLNPNFLLLIFVFLIFDTIFLKNILLGNLRRPEITERIKNIWLVCLFSLILTFCFLYFNKISISKTFFLGEILLILTPFLGIFLTIPLVRRAKRMEREKAIKVISKYNPITIGITGSYGKTTTKDFLTQILSTKYNVLSTLKNQNTFFGVLRRVNNYLNKDHQFLVAEIGAYKIGEIREVAEIIKPEAAFITGIEPQHLDIFGNIENLKRAKFELVESLKDGGMLFVNANSYLALEFVERAEKLGKNIKCFTYFVGNDSKLGDHKYSAFSKVEILRDDGIEFSIKVFDERKKIKTNIVSKSFIQNLTGVILAARMFGIGWKEIERESKKLYLPDGTLNITKIKKGITLIDDSYNSSFSGFKAALEVLFSVSSGRKIIVTTGIIELGKESDTVHENLGDLIGKNADIVILRNGDFFKPLSKGIKGRCELIYIRDQERIIDYLEKEIKEKDSVLIEGRLPKVVEYFSK